VHGDEELDILAVDTQLEDLALRVPLKLVQHRELPKSIWRAPR
jgi:hypothetical protein